MASPKLEVGSWVTVTGRFKPARIAFSQTSNTHYVVLEELNAKPDGKHDIIKLRAPSFEGLRQEIVRRWPQATFSVTNENPISRTENGIVLDARTVQAKSEWSAEKDTVLESAAADFANRQRLEEMPVEEKQELTKQNILQMMRENVWLSNNPTFFAWGPGQENYQTLLAYFAAMTWELPSIEQCAHTFRWLWDA